jgi:hypothetical protein
MHEYSSKPTKQSLLERIAQIIEPKDRPSGYRSPAKRTWQKALYSRVARYYPTPSTQGDRTGIKFQDGTTLLRRADGSLRYFFPKVRRTGAVRRAEKRLRRLNKHRIAHGQAPI